MSHEHRGIQVELGTKISAEYHYGNSGSGSNSSSSCNRNLREVNIRISPSVWMWPTTCNQIKRRLIDIDLALLTAWNADTSKNMLITPIRQRKQLGQFRHADTDELMNNLAGQ